MRNRWIAVAIILVLFLLYEDLAIILHRESLLQLAPDSSAPQKEVDRLLERSL